MNTLSCTAEDIFHLNNSKEYTLTATCILERALTDKNLMGHAANLWYLLFSKAKYNPTLEVEICYAELANWVGKSVRTVFRYIHSLAKNGYLMIKNNFDKSGNQLANTLAIRLPKWLTDEANDANDRLKPKLVIPTPIAPDKQDDLLSNDDAKIVTPSHDNPGSPYINNLILKNNNNTVVAIPPSSQPVATNTLKTNDDIEKQLQPLLTAKDNAEQIWLSDPTNLHKLQAFHDADNQLNMARIRGQHLVQAKRAKQQQQICEQAITTQPDYLNKIPGERTLTPFSLKRLQASLEKITHTPMEKARLANEIIYEIRFGALVKSNADKEQNNLERAMNIALKLIREQRWSTPYGLQEFLKANNQRVVSTQHCST